MRALQMVDALRAQMVNEMAENVCKGDRWCEAEVDTLEYELLYHAVKLIWAGRAGDKPGVREYAADVANHAGMLADRLGALSATPSPGNASVYLEGTDAARELAVSVHLQIISPPV